MSDISLTKGMRSNLLALQSTVKLLDRTQERLSTGKKVNSALDNPVNFFTAQSHNSRANDLLAYKDGISEAIQTIKAADNAIKAITTLIDSMKGIAEDAKGTLGSTGTVSSQTLTISDYSGVTAGTTIDIGGTTFTAVSGVATCATQFSVGSASNEGVAAALAAAINSATEGRNMDATVEGSILTISLHAGGTMVATDIGFVHALDYAYAESSVTATDELSAKVNQYNELIAQLDNLQDDAFYKGKNLLGSAAGGSDDMTVRFGNSKTLTVSSFLGDHTGLGLSGTASWTSETTIQADIDLLDAALTTLRIESSKLSSNLSIINARDEWITGIANILQTGADNLTLADTNEEGANMLMLQTRQSLSTNALSLSAQAAQSVLQLFQ
ncbi:MAG: flagellin [Syntrophorhabdus sp. PtaB.Bin047]|nr:MAG: flagellin [Syntrophorhabdus sp. PtaB.Bin047]